MVNEKFRKALEAYVKTNEIQENYGDVIILDNHAYDNSIVGITDTGILIYDYEKMVEEFSKDEGCEELEAMEWVDYNTMRALPYMGERKPIIIQNSAQWIVDFYGEVFGGEQDDE